MVLDKSKRILCLIGLYGKYSILPGSFVRFLCLFSLLSSFTSVAAYAFDQTINVHNMNSVTYVSTSVASIILIYLDLIRRKLLIEWLIYRFDQIVVKSE